MRRYKNNLLRRAISTAVAACLLGMQIAGPGRSGFAMQTAPANCANHSDALAPTSPLEQRAEQKRPIQGMSPAQMAKMQLHLEMGIRMLAEAFKKDIQSWDRALHSFQSMLSELSAQIGFSITVERERFEIRSMAGKDVGALPLTVGKDKVFEIIFYDEGQWKADELCLALGMDHQTPQKAILSESLPGVLLRPVAASLPDKQLPSIQEQTQYGYFGMLWAFGAGLTLLAAATVSWTGFAWLNIPWLIALVYLQLQVAELYVATLAGYAVRAVDGASKHLDRRDYSAGIPDEQRGAIAYMLLSASKQQSREAIDAMAWSYMNNLDPNANTGAVLVSVTKKLSLVAEEMDYVSRTQRQIQKTLLREGLAVLDALSKEGGNLQDVQIPEPRQKFWSVWFQRTQKQAKDMYQAREMLGQYVGEIASNFNYLHRNHLVLRKAGQYQDFMALTSLGLEHPFTYVGDEWVVYDLNPDGSKKLGADGKPIVLRDWGRRADQKNFGLSIGENCENDADFTAAQIENLMRRHEEHVQKIKQRQYAYTLVLDEDNMATPRSLIDLVAIAAANPESTILQPSLRADNELETMFTKVTSEGFYAIDLYVGGRMAVEGKGPFFGKGLIRNRAYIDEIMGTPEQPKHVLQANILSHDVMEKKYVRTVYVQDVVLTEKALPNLIAKVRQTSRWLSGGVRNFISERPGLLGRAVEILGNWYAKIFRQPVLWPAQRYVPKPVHETWVDRWLAKEGIVPMPVQAAGLVVFSLWFLSEIAAESFQLANPFYFNLLYWIPFLFGILALRLPHLMYPVLETMASGLQGRSFSPRSIVRGTVNQLHTIGKRVVGMYLKLFLGTGLFVPLVLPQQSISLQSIVMNLVGDTKWRAQQAVNLEESQLSMKRILDVTGMAPLFGLGLLLLAYPFGVAVVLKFWIFLQFFIFHPFLVHVSSLPLEETFLGRLLIWSGTHQYFSAKKSKAWDDMLGITKSKPVPTRADVALGLFAVLGVPLAITAVLYGLINIHPVVLFILVSSGALYGYVTLYSMISLLRGAWRDRPVTPTSTQWVNRMAHTAIPYIAATLLATTILGAQETQAPSLPPATPAIAGIQARMETVLSEITWPAVPGAQRYELLIADNPQFQGAKSRWPSSNVEPAEPLGLRKNQNAYYFKVRAWLVPPGPENGGKGVLLTEDWSPVYEVKNGVVTMTSLPSAEAPSSQDGMKNIFLHVQEKDTKGKYTVEWSEVDGAQRYELQEETGEWGRAFMHPRMYWPTANSVPIEHLGQKGRYYYRVRAWLVPPSTENPKGILLTDWSPIQYIDLEPAQPQKPAPAPEFVPVEEGAVQPLSGDGVTRPLDSASNVPNISGSAANAPEMGTLAGDVPNSTGSQLQTYLQPPSPVSSSSESSTARSTASSISSANLPPTAEEEAIVKQLTVEKPTIMPQVYYLTINGTGYHVPTSAPIAVGLQQGNALQVRPVLGPIPGQEARMELVCAQGNVHVDKIHAGSKLTTDTASASFSIRINEALLKEGKETMISLGIYWETYRGKDKTASGIAPLVLRVTPSGAHPQLSVVDTTPMKKVMEQAIQNPSKENPAWKTMKEGLKGPNQQLWEWMILLALGSLPVLYAYHRYAQERRPFMSVAQRVALFAGLVMLLGGKIQGKTASDALDMLLSGTSDGAKPQQKNRYLRDAQVVSLSL